MNTETMKSDWNETKAKIKAKFGKLTDESIDSMKGNLSLLSEKLQKTYGYAKDQADREYEGFKAKLHNATEPGRDKGSEYHSTSESQKKESETKGAKHIA